MNQLLGSLEQISTIVALISAAVAAIGALIQYSLKVREERRLKKMALLETDIKTSHLFSELISTANGYGGWSEPQKEIVNDIIESIPQELKQSLLMSDPKRYGILFSGTLIPTSVPLSQQLAAAETVASLAIRYPFLKEAALIGLDVVVGFMPQAKDAYDRLCSHYGLERPLTEWDFNKAGK
jgi:hypothetical protein